MVDTDNRATTAHDHVRDKVAQVYLGVLDWGATGDVLRRRIDWMADESRGPHVLDVGCSEGILEVLLARRGLDVTGVEVNADALDFARELLAQEPDEVRARARLVHGDFIKAHPVTGLFDTVVLGEILEHLHDPGALLDRSLEYLRPGGRVVITTPFGLLPHEDHHQTFCLTDVIDLLKPSLALEHIGVEDGYIRFVGRLSSDHEVSWQRLDADEVLSMTDAALLASQTKLYEMLAARGGRIERFQRRMELLQEQKERLQSRVAAGQEKAERLQDRLDAGRERIQRLERRAKFDRMASAQLETASVQLKKNLEDREGEVRVLRHRLQAAYSSTSFLAGSALVSAAKQPRTLWKLPSRLLRLYRSASTLPVETNAEDNSDDRYQDLPPDLDLDVSRFINYPPLPIPEAKVDGPPVAAILDTFTEHSLRYEANLLLLSRERWRSQMEKARPECLLVESAFIGNNGEWQRRVLRYESLEDNPLRELLQYCRSNRIPTVFWNKEDPPHFDDFIGAAREFDFVFTTDADCVPLYRETLGHDRVYVLPFAAQPRLHNPSREEDWPNYPVCFPGSWVQHRYPDRVEALRFLLDPSLPLGLHIFDRNLTRIEMGSNYHFPNKYREAIKGTLTYKEMLTAYRCYNVILNVNTVTESPTMFSRRVFESLACGTPVISSESVGMSRMLGEHVRVAHNIEDATDHLVEVLGDEEARVREGHLAYRFVHENHTYRHRMAEVFRRVGLESLVSEQPSVSVLMPTMRPENVSRCLDNFKKQTYPNKELVLILNNAEFDLNAIREHTDLIPNVRVLHVDERTTLGDCLNRGVEVASGKYIAKMDDDDHYGERYLSDSVLAASFSDAEVVGKGMHFVYLEAPGTTALLEKTPEHTFTFFVRGATLFIRNDVVRDISFDSISIKEDTNFQRTAARAGCKIYSADRFNFMQVRTRRLSDHTTQTPDAELLKECRDHTPGLDLGRAMI